MKRNAVLVGLLSSFVLLLVWIKPVEPADHQQQQQNAVVNSQGKAESPEKFFDKRSSNWAKAGSMWGKRNGGDQPSDNDDDDTDESSPEEMTKRGWEKAGSMWGKRDNTWAKASSMWGKRTNNNWSKASSMWGKRR